MKLYPKKLQSVAELAREKEVLKYARKHLSTEDIFSMKGIMGGKSGPKTKEKADTGKSGNLLEGLNVNKLLVDILLKYALPKNLRRQESLKAAREAKHSPLLRRAAFEFIGGYLKWKAIELSYKGIRKAVQKSKEAKKKIA